jgi:heme exporter protein D
MQMSSVTLQYNTTHQDREITSNPKPGNYNSLPKQRRNNIQPEVISSLFGIGGYFFFVWDLRLFLYCLGLEVISSLFGIGGYFFFVWDWRLFRNNLPSQTMKK